WGTAGGARSAISVGSEKAGPPCGVVWGVAAAAVPPRSSAMLTGGAVGGRVSATGGVGRTGAGSVRVVTPSSSLMLGEGVVGGEPVCDAACVDRSGPIGKRSVTGPLDGGDALAASAFLGGAADEAETGGFLTGLGAASGRGADEAGPAGLLTVLGAASGTRGAVEAGTAGLLTVLGAASERGTAGLLTVFGAASGVRD